MVKKAAVEKEQDYPKQDLDHTHMEDLPAAVRWVSLLGINGWFTKKWREVTPAGPIILTSCICYSFNTNNW